MKGNKDQGKRMASLHFCPKQNGKFSYYKDACCTYTIKVAKQYFLIGEIMGDCDPYFLRCLIFFFLSLFFSMSQFSLHKRRKRFLFWRTEVRHPPLPAPHTPPIPPLTLGTAGSVRRALASVQAARDHHVFTPPNTWPCYKGAAMELVLEHGRHLNKFLLMWVSLLCLDWARILLTDPLGFNITSIQWFSMGVPSPSLRVTGHSLETGVVTARSGGAGGVCYWDLVGRSQRSCLSSFPAQDSPDSKELSSPEFQVFRYRNVPHHLPFLRLVKYPPNSSWSIIYCKLTTRTSLEDRARIINWFEDKFELERRLQTVSQGSSGTGGLSGWHDTPCLRWTEGKDWSNLTDDFSVRSLKITT